MNAVERARSFIGTAYRYRGRRPGIALDCVGILVLAYGLPEPARYAVFPGDAIGSLRKYAHPVTDAPVAGDIAVMFLYREPRHLGIFTDCNSVIHADSTLRQVVETPLSAVQIHSFWRLT